MAPLCSASPRPLEAPGQPRRRARAPRTVVVAAGSRARASGDEARVSLVLALASQALAASQRRAADLVAEAAKYASPSRRFEPRTLEEALMSVPDLETVPFRVLKREADYEIREVESYFIAETTMPGRSGFDFNGSSQSFNVLASYLFGKNTTSEQMEMTTPVFTRKGEPTSETMDMTTPVITKKSAGENKWKMSFVMPAKYGSNLPHPKDSSVTIKEVPSKIVAVTAFSGLVTDDDISQRESKLREFLQKDTEFRVKDDSVVEVAQIKDQLAELYAEGCKAEKGNPLPVGVVDMTELKQGADKYYRYVGSVTAPPCTENVIRNILAQVREMTKEQAADLMAPLERGYRHNSRPLQSLNGRMVQLYDRSLKIRKML